MKTRVCLKYFVNDCSSYQRLHHFQAGALRKFVQKQPFKGVLRKRCSENMHQIYSRTPMLKCDLLCNFIEIALRHGCYPVNFLHIFRTPFSKNTSGGLLLFAVN